MSLLRSRRQAPTKHVITLTSTDIATLMVVAALADPKIWREDSEQRRMIDLSKQTLAWTRAGDSIALCVKDDR